MKVILREKETITKMTIIYCKGVHQTIELCNDCTTFLKYAKIRLDKCPFQNRKPTCAKCHVHCYQPTMREKVREVMRYSGPRMLIRHPILVLLHLCAQILA